MSSETIKPYVIFEKNSENFSITYTLSGASYASTGITIEPYREGGLLVFLKKSGFMNKDLAKLHNFCLCSNDKGEVLESSNVYSVNCGVDAERVFLYLASMENSTNVFYLSLSSNFLEKYGTGAKLDDSEAYELAKGIDKITNDMKGNDILLLECAGHMSVICKTKDNKLYYFDSTGLEDSKHKIVYEKLKKIIPLVERNLQTIGGPDAGFCGLVALKFADSFIKSSNKDASLGEARTFIHELNENVRKNKKGEIEKLLSEQFIQQKTQQKSGVKIGVRRK